MELGAGPSLTRSSGGEMDPNQRHGFPTGNYLNIMGSVCLCSVLQRLPGLGGMPNVMRNQGKAS